MSNNPSSTGCFSNRSSQVGWGSSASANERSNSVASTGSSSVGSFANPWGHPKSDMCHVGVPGGRLPRGSGIGNGNFMTPQKQMLASGKNPCIQSRTRSNQQ